MSVRLYMDVHVRRAVTEGLRLRGVDLLTAQEDGAESLQTPTYLSLNRLGGAGAELSERARTAIFANHVAGHSTIYAGRN